MKLTKGMKKALSLLLSGALVLTGVNVTTASASEADGTAEWNGLYKAGYKNWDGDGSDDVEASLEQDEENNDFNFSDAVDITVNPNMVDFVVPEYITEGEIVITGTEAPEGESKFALWDDGWSGAVAGSDNEPADVKELRGTVKGGENYHLCVGLGRNVTHILITKVESLPEGPATLSLQVTALGWNNTDGSTEVAKPGKYSITVEPKAETLVNFGVLSATGVDALTGTLDSVVVNGEYTFEGGIKQAIDPLDGTANGLVNIWNIKEKFEKGAAVIDTAVENEAVQLYGIDDKNEEGEDAGIWLKVDGENVAFESITYNLTVETVELTASEQQTPPPSKNKFNVYWNYVGDNSWNGDNTWAEDDYTTTVDRDGDYTISYKAGFDTEDIYMMFLSTDLEPEYLGEDFQMLVTKVTVGAENAENPTEYEMDPTVNEKNGQSIHFYKGDKGDNTLRYAVRVPMAPADLDGDYIEDFDGFSEGDSNYTDAFTLDTTGDHTVVPVAKGEVITVHFSVKGVDGMEIPEPTEEPSEAPTETPTEKPSAAPSGAPSATPTGNAITTPGAVTPGAVGATSKITPKKNKVVIAAGKSKTVKFTTKVDSPATQAAVVTASIAKKKIVSKAVVTGDKVKITAAKKATKGANTTVTLKSTKADGSVVSAKIKVIIQNKAKKVKAAKKSVVIAKKGKKAKVTLKVTAQNKKKATTDAVKVKSNKVAKLAKYSAKKGKVVVTLKGKKKGTGNVTIQVGSKKVKVKVTVKK